MTEQFHTVRIAVDQVSPPPRRLPPTMLISRFVGSVPGRVVDPSTCPPLCHIRGGPNVTHRDEACASDIWAGEPRHGGTLWGAVPTRSDGATNYEVPHRSGWKRQQAK